MYSLHSEPWKVLVRAIARRTAHDSDFIRVIVFFHHAKRVARNIDEKLDEVSKLALSKILTRSNR